MNCTVHVHIFAVFLLIDSTTEQPAAHWPVNRVTYETNEFGMVTLMHLTRLK